MSTLSNLRRRIRHLHRISEDRALEDLVRHHGLAPEDRAAISAKASQLVNRLRESSTPGLMEVFLAEYGLSTDEGVALMCLAEALLRVPDEATIDELIEDKIAPSAWGEHLGKSSSSLVNASTWALMLTGKVLKEPADEGLASTLRSAVKRLGEPVIRTAVKRAMKEMGHQFVLGEDIEEAIRRGQTQANKGFTYSYDMLGEAALTERDARMFYDAYAEAIQSLARRAIHDDIRQNPGISIKLSALHPRYEAGQHARVMAELVPRVRALAVMAREAQMGLNIDAEEADRLDLSLDVIEAVLRAPELAGWDGFGVVVQAYGKRAPAVIDWLHTIARELDRRLMVRLVKGAYWDTEIKQAQIDGVPDFPVYSRKAATDVAYICCAQKLLGYADRLYPQFATHNAHTICAILKMADGQVFEFQRLHGMGEALHQIIHEEHGTACRIYAPVGAHSDLLAYLVRRLLENGANSSFVNQIVDEDVSPEIIAADPFTALDEYSAGVQNPRDLFQPERINSRGWDLRNPDDIEAFDAARNAFKAEIWKAGPMVAGDVEPAPSRPAYSPNRPDELVGHVAEATLETVDVALAQARDWSKTSPEKRCVILNRAADLYEANAGEIFAALCREAGKTPVDAVAEIREAVDFLRYYASEGVRHGDMPARGIITCISPWNFPLAIFTGQIAAALAAGNGVLAKPAEPTPVIAHIAVRLMREAGVPDAALQLLPGRGATVGKALTSDPRVNGVCFTGSTGVAQAIYRTTSATLEPDATFIAETGGLNAMIVDSTALPEQAVRDIVDSAFRSCGQRCSALRMLYLQNDIAEGFLEMLYGAMDALVVADPWSHSSDVGPIITQKARDDISGYIDAAHLEGRLRKQIDAQKTGHFIGPAVIEVDGIASLEREVFGPVLHFCTFEAHEIDQIVDDINASGYGLTFGLHTRIDDRVQDITTKLNVGNLYVNRNQIGAIVGSQPFGGEGLSGTGPKAGGPHYVKRFRRYPLPLKEVVSGAPISLAQAQSALDDLPDVPRAARKVIDMPGPTGESNRWSTHGRGVILCLGPTAQDAAKQMARAYSAGCVPLGIAPWLAGKGAMDGFLPRELLSALEGFDAVSLWSAEGDLRQARQALAARAGALLPLIATDDMHDFCLIERHLCIDTTAAGGNAALLAAQ